MKLSDAVTIPPQVMARTVGDETVILDLASGTYFGLDPVGARIWALMGDGRALADICATMLEEYEQDAGGDLRDHAGRVRGRARATGDRCAQARCGVARARAGCAPA